MIKVYRCYSNPSRMDRLETFTRKSIKSLSERTGTPDYMSLESVFASGFAKLIGGDRDCQPYKDLSSWWLGVSDLGPAPLFRCKQ